MTVEEFRDVVALWHVNEARDTEVVLAACELVVAGVDGPAVSMLAGASLKHAGEEVPPLLGDAMRELGLQHHEHRTDGGKEQGLRLMARRTVAGEMSPRDLAGWVHGEFGHYLSEAEELARLDDVYDILEYEDLTAADVDQQVLAEARRLTA
ncbi:hypothetical protein [Lentzea flaviverrucosa]|uniref:Uncharacterized protein n=1 Tax=Lentzea flaviverrucosa TaxID=200379 RepID=A0A1H9MS59_9PSEU|nr:hypothetical protein [Lentzea flaviverrucosa]RDI30815.1 hypothetical protein DFR72_104147 [Lentzea flaviverrucosa]SER26255.1 hypothetical protein SAMN05216195_104480 [Lentzea flaviverrucosa]